ncbi:MAG: hypothetical protein PHS80_12085 [Methanothrix sp.]|nr:hypothetical protein [Methanothrix sp.]MDD4447553.1 hypothetical protein [Methanothrix sp.]
MKRFCDRRRRRYGITWKGSFYLNTPDFIREAVREKLAAIKVIEYHDVDYQTAKKEVAGYFQMKGEAYASDASTDLQLDYEQVIQIMDDLEKEGKMETS